MRPTTLPAPRGLLGGLGLGGARRGTGCRCSDRQGLLCGGAEGRARGLPGVSLRVGGGLPGVAVRRRVGLRLLRVLRCRVARGRRRLLGRLPGRMCLGRRCRRHRRSDGGGRSHGLPLHRVPGRRQAGTRVRWAHSCRGSGLPVDWPGCRSLNAPSSSSLQSDARCCAFLMPRMGLDYAYRVSGSSTVSRCETFLERGSVRRPAPASSAPTDRSTPPSSRRCRRLAARTGAINLGQGFPDEDGPAEVLEAARAAIANGVNQYPPGRGIPDLLAAIAEHQERFYGVLLDPASRCARHGRRDGGARRDAARTDRRTRRRGRRLRAALRLVRCRGRACGRAIGHRAAALARLPARPRRPAPRGQRPHAHHPRERSAQSDGRCLHGRGARGGRAPRRAPRRGDRDGRGL